MKPTEGDLLIELAILIKSYPAQERLKLARVIEQKHTRSRVVSFLRGTSTLTDIIGNHSAPPKSEQRTRRKTKKSPTGKPESYEKLQLELAQMPTRALREIALKAGLPVRKKDSRKRVFERIVRSPKFKLSQAEGKGASALKGNDYGQWARIILGKSDKDEVSH